MMMALVQDIGAGLRLFRRQPGFFATVILTLAVGIGAATTMFTLVHAVLLRDFPFQHPDRLVWSARKRELAIRSAFGASRDVLASLVFAEEVRPVLLGLVIGLSAALAVSQFLGGILFAISPTDPLTYAGVAAVLLAVNAADVYVPARRAGLIDPVQLLRQ
jgi:FtsX-like permease family